MATLDFDWTVFFFFCGVGGGVQGACGDYSPNLRVGTREVRKEVAHYVFYHLLCTYD